MSRQLNTPARYVGGDALPLLLRCEDQIGKPGARYALRDRCLRFLWREDDALRRPASHKSHIVARFGRESSVACYGDSLSASVLRCVSFTFSHVLSRC